MRSSSSVSPKPRGFGRRWCRAPSHRIWVGAGAGALFALGVGCSSDEFSVGGPAGGNAGDAGVGGAAGAGAGAAAAGGNAGNTGEGGNSGGATGGASTGGSAGVSGESGGGGGECMPTTADAKRIRARLHVLVDRADASRQTWPALTGGLEQFAKTAPKETFVGVELAPAQKVGATTSCPGGLDSECGTAGPCWNLACPTDASFPCSSENEWCTGGSACRKIGRCSATGQFCYVGAPFAGCGSCTAQTPPVCLNGEECGATAYGKADLPIAPVSGQLTGLNTLLSSGPLDGQGFPLLPAITGALQYIDTWSTGQPLRPAALVVLANGAPSACGTDTVSLLSISTAAKQAQMRTPPVNTYVIGNYNPLNTAVHAFYSQLAKDGGTGSVRTLRSASVSSDLLKALGEVADAETTCEFELPVTTDLGKVTLALSNGQKPKFNPSGVGCTGAGWSYDLPPPGNPTRVVLCTDTCSALKADRTIHASFSIGCKSE